MRKLRSMLSSGRANGRLFHRIIVKFRTTHPPKMAVIGHRYHPTHQPIDSTPRRVKLTLRQTFINGASASKVGGCPIPGGHEPPRMRHHRPARRWPSSVGAATRRRRPLLRMAWKPRTMGKYQKPPESSAPWRVGRVLQPPPAKGERWVWRGKEEGIWGELTKCFEEGHVEKNWLDPRLDTNHAQGSHKMCFPCPHFGMGPPLPFTLYFPLLLRQACEILGCKVATLDKT